MKNWIFTEDFELKKNFRQAINLNFISHIALRLEDCEVVLFCIEDDIGPYVFEFTDTELCQTAYENIKEMLKSSNVAEAVLE
ncbi:MAG: hypothetical protein WCL30_01875 [Pseudomonadota bacterium]